MAKNLINLCAEIFTSILTLIKRHKFFFVFVVAYCAILVAFSRYAPNLDDSWIWLKIIEGKSNEIYNGFKPQIGRFWTLGLVDLVLLMKISTSPYLFFGVNAVLFALFSTLYLKILNISNGKNALNAIITALLTLNISFVIVIFGIYYPEKLQVIWLSIFMLCSFCAIRDMGGGKSAKSTQSYQIISIISLNIALYYKEPTFIAAFAFGAVLLISALQNRHKDLAKYALCIIFSACFYVFLYKLLIVDEVDKFYSALTAKDAFALLQGFAFNESILTFSISGFLLYRIYCVCVKKERIEAYFDGLLCASFGYFSAFVVLKMYALYYCLPCFVLGIPSVLYFSRKYWHNMFVKICLILGLFGFFTQNLPSGIHKMIDLKAQGVQLHQTLDFVAQYLQQNKGANLYFEGIGRGREIYDFEVGMRPFWFAEYLEKFYSIYDFDLQTSAPNSADFRPNPKAKYTLLNSDMLSAPKGNDLIIVSNKSAFGDSLNRAGERGELIFVSGFPSIPHIALMPFIKYLNAKYFKSDIFGKNDNFFALPCRTYVFRAD